MTHIQCIYINNKLQTVINSDDADNLIWTGANGDAVSFAAGKFLIESGAHLDIHMLDTNVRVALWKWRLTLTSSS